MQLNPFIFYDFLSTRELKIDQYVCTVCGKKCNPQFYWVNIIDNYIVCIWGALDVMDTTVNLYINPITKEQINFSLVSYQSPLQENIVYRTSAARTQYINGNWQSIVGRKLTLKIIIIILHLINSSNERHLCVPRDRPIFSRIGSKKVRIIFVLDD